MKIDFLEGRARPADSNQASKLTSECGIHTRNKMHVATHWKDYNKEQLKHSIPNAISAVAVRHIPSFFSFTCSHVALSI